MGATGDAVSEWERRRGRVGWIGEVKMRVGEGWLRGAGKSVSVGVGVSVNVRLIECECECECECGCE